LCDANWNVVEVTPVQNPNFHKSEIGTKVRKTDFEKALANGSIPPGIAANVLRMRAPYLIADTLQV
jgi:hypothetical protein